MAATSPASTSEMSAARRPRTASGRLAPVEVEDHLLQRLDAPLAVVDELAHAVVSVKTRADQAARAAGAAKRGARMVLEVHVLEDVRLQRLQLRHEDAVGVAAPLRRREAGGEPADGAEQVADPEVILVHPRNLARHDLRVRRARHERGEEDLLLLVQVRSEARREGIERSREILQVGFARTVDLRDLGHDRRDVRQRAAQIAVVPVDDACDERGGGERARILLGPPTARGERGLELGEQRLGIEARGPAGLGDAHVTVTAVVDPMLLEDARGRGVLGDSERGHRERKADRATGGKQPKRVFAGSPGGSLAELGPGGAGQRSATTRRLRQIGRAHV